MKEFGNINKRQAGVLLPISSLPGNYGIGDLGNYAYEFIDEISKMGFKIWQILPINPSSAGNSPYTPYSSYAGDELYISLDQLVTDGLLKETKYYNQDANMVHYDDVRKYKHEYLLEAFENFKKEFNNYKKEYQSFKTTAFWLEDYAHFMALNKKNFGSEWTQWPESDLNYKNNRGLKNDMDYVKFIQYIFFKQFDNLKDYAHKKGISIMGDMPLYVGLDSEDVYNHQECFELDENHLPKYISGASPDYFNEDGQVWGHPIYNWDELKETNYEFWVNRFKWNNAIFDILRIDHFRAFDTYWAIPYGDTTARNGIWKEGPSYDFFDSVYKQIPNLNIVVEDLGNLREEVHELRDYYNLMGMKIIQFSFGEDDENNGFKMPVNCITYTGTHDNEPIASWYDQQDDYWKNRISNILNRFNLPEDQMYMRVLHRTLACESLIAIATVQDLMGLGNDSRFNYPGTEGEPNWCWKLVDLNEFKQNYEYINWLLTETKRI